MIFDVSHLNFEYVARNATFGVGFFDGPFHTADELLSIRSGGPGQGGQHTDFETLSSSDREAFEQDIPEFLKNWI
ncbi:hypothetical protein [Ruegeria sp.]|uniref:hypothetical protein n=1 Tax=Ruegeria sp. TaxID=1879320 RepID=UPI00230DFFF4|nr:hypothetical protein [Ruegeria sp.]MDA7966517.1 hypothetical protein [Ruegeria sp.]